MTGLALLARTAVVIAKILACVSGPQLLGCVLPILCALLTLLGGWMEWFNRCFQTPACVSPTWTIVNILIGLIGAICEGGIFALGNWEKIRDGLLRLRGIRPPDFVGI